MAVRYTSRQPAAGSGSVSRVDIKALTPHRIIDPTGVGDAFRGGLMKGMALAKSFKESAQMGTVAATYALEHLGGQSHAYTMKRVQRSIRRALRIVVSVTSVPGA